MGVRRELCQQFRFCSVHLKLIPKLSCDEEKNAFHQYKMEIYSELQKQFNENNDSLRLTEVVKCITTWQNITVS